MKMKSVYCYMLAGLMLSASSCSSWLSEDDAPVMSYDYYETEAGVNAAIIVAANVFIAILLSTLVYRIEKMTAAKLFGCVIGFLGIILCNLNGLKGGIHLSFLGDGFIFLCTVASPRDAARERRACNG